MKASDLPLQYNAVDILERNLPRLSDKVALYGPDREMTFREVSAEANQVANAMSASPRRGKTMGWSSAKGVRPS